MDARVYYTPGCKPVLVLTFALVMEIVVIKQNTTETEKCIFLRGEGRGWDISYI
jgi:hypothetical protein